MKKLFTLIAALMLSAVIATGQSAPARADGFLFWFGGYLLADGLLGVHCNRQEWPLNGVRIAGDAVQGRDGCRYTRNFRGYHWYY